MKDSQVQELANVAGLGRDIGTLVEGSVMPFL